MTKNIRQSSYTHEHQRRKSINKVLFVIYNWLWFKHISYIYLFSFDTILTQARLMMLIKRSLLSKFHQCDSHEDWERLNCNQHNGGQYDDYAKSLLTTDTLFQNQLHHQDCG